MRTKTLLISAILIFLFSDSFGQGKRYVYYLDYNLDVCDKAASVFTGHGILQNNLLNLKVYANQNPEVVLLIANFTDSSLAVNQGLFQTFYIDGSVETECNYENNEINGTWKKWDSTSHLTDSINYDHGKKIDSAAFYYFKNGALSSYHITNFENDQFRQINYNDSGKITSEVFFTGQKGVMKIYDGPVIKIDSLSTREEKEASFPGGEAGWTRYISKQINSHLDDLSNKDYGTCVVRFIIDTDGKVSDVHATTMLGSTLASIAVEAVKSGPKWIPAKQYGRIVKAYRLQPVTLVDPTRGF
jgi:antitoxin component YwqK of YwqJK toxin-antitoxin module